MIVNVIGLGYIGLPTALCLAAAGVTVTGTDKCEQVVKSLRQGSLTFREKGIDPLFKQAIDSGKLTTSSTCVSADIYVVAVPTPYMKHTKKIDPAYLVQAVCDIMKVCPKGAIIAVESTVSPGTIDREVRPIIEQRGFVCGCDLHIAHVPERIIPGNMIYELEHNNRTIGVDDPAVGETLAALYSSFSKGNIIITDIRTAELTKVAENTFRDINIAYANELALICNREGLDVYEVIRIANMHPRVNILSPGPGVGGHCISVDPWFLIGDYPDLCNIIRAAREVNDAMPQYVLGRVSELMKEHGITCLQEVGFYGLTYKENVDDIRESPTLQLIEHMQRHLAFGARIYDPMVESPAVDGQIMDFDEFIAGSRLVVIMVGHDHIKAHEDVLRDKIVLDTRRCLKSTLTYGL